MVPLSKPGTVKPNTGTEAGEQAVQVIVRAAERSRERWKEAAAKKGISMSEFVREAADAAATEILDCSHDNVRTYPWATFCNRCGLRLKG